MSLLPSITTINPNQSLFAPYTSGGGGGGGGPNPAFSTITVQQNATIGGDITATNCSLRGTLVASTINAYQFNNISSITSAGPIRATATGYAFNDGVATTQITGGNLIVQGYVGGGAYLETPGYVSAPVLTVSSINGANFNPPPAPGFAVSKILTTGGTPGTNGIEFTVPTSGTLALTNAFSVLTNHLYRLSIFLDQAQNNDSAATTTRIIVTEAGNSALGVTTLYAENNPLINSTSPIQGAAALQVVFVPLFASIQIYATNSSTTDTSFLSLNNGKAASYTNVGFILEDMGVAP